MNTTTEFKAQQMFSVGDKVISLTDSKKVVGVVTGFMGDCLLIEWSTVTGKTRKGRRGFLLYTDVSKV